MRSRAAGMSVTLGELVGRIDRLEVACRRCDRRGRLRLVAEHGPSTTLPDGRAPTPGEGRFVYFPQLAEPPWPGGRGRRAEVRRARARKGRLRGCWCFAGALAGGSRFRRERS